VVERVADVHSAIAAGLVALPFGAYALLLFHEATAFIALRKAKCAARQVAGQLLRRASCLMRP
jgi:hypothetical protein